MYRSLVYQSKLPKLGTRTLSVQIVDVCVLPIIMWPELPSIRRSDGKNLDLVARVCLVEIHDLCVFSMKFLRGLDFFENIEKRALSLKMKSG